MTDLSFILFDRLDLYRIVSESVAGSPHAFCAFVFTLFAEEMQFEYAMQIKSNV